MTRTTSLQLAAAALLLAAAAGVQAAPVYTYSVEGAANISQNSVAGEISAIKTVYDPNTESFTWTYSIEDKSDGFWLVVSDGENPKSNAYEYAILYGDLDQNRLTAYVYNGQNNPQSWLNTPGNTGWSTPGIFLDSFASKISVTDPSPNLGDIKDVSFTIDVSTINNAVVPVPSNFIDPGWDGVAFSELVGIWFHPTKGTTFAYDDTMAGEGRITGFSAQKAGWFDGKNFETTQVSEPGLLHLIGTGSVALIFSHLVLGARRRRFSSAEPSRIAPAT